MKEMLEQKKFILIILKHYIFNAEVFFIRKPRARVRNGHGNERGMYIVDNHQHRRVSGLESPRPQAEAIPSQKLRGGGGYLT